MAHTSKRITTEGHNETLQTNGWYDNDRRVVIMDEGPEKDILFNITNHNKINITYAGNIWKNMTVV